MPLRRGLNKDIVSVLFAAGCWIAVWTWINLQLLHNLSVFV